MSESTPAPQGTPGTAAPPPSIPATTTTPATSTPAAPATRKYADKYASVEELHKGIVNADPSYTLEQLAKVPVDVAENLYKTAQRALTKDRMAGSGNAPSGGNDNPLVIPAAPAKAEVDEGATPRQIIEKAGLNYDAVMTELSKGGKLSEATRKTLADTYKWDNTAITLATKAAMAHHATEQATHAAEVAARNAQLETQVYPMFGGRDKMEAMLRTAQEKFSPAEVKFFNDAFASKNVDEVKTAASAFLMMLAHKTGHQIGTTVTATPMAATADKPPTISDVRGVLSTLNSGTADLSKIHTVLTNYKKGNK